MNDSMKKRLEATKERYEQIEKELSDENIDSDLEKLTKLSKEKANLTEAYDLYCRYLKLEQEVKDSYELEADPEMTELAKDQRKADQAEMEKMENDFQTILLPKDPNDDKNIIVEIRGAVGGDEATLFAGDFLPL